jgi:hypothetical protein
MEQKALTIPVKCFSKMPRFDRQCFTVRILGAHVEPPQERDQGNRGRHS